MKKNLKNDLIVLTSGLTAAVLVYIFNRIIILNYIMIILSIYIIITSAVEIKKERWNAVVLIIIAMIALVFLLRN